MCLIEAVILFYLMYYIYLSLTVVSDSIPQVNGGLARIQINQPATVSVQS